MTNQRVDGIICFGGDRWGDVKRPSQLMLQLSRRVPVVYAEPYLSATSVLKNWRTAFSPHSSARLVRALSGTTDQAAPDLHLTSTMVAIPPNRLSHVVTAKALEAMSARYHRAAARRAYRVAEQLGISSPVLWVSYPLPLTEPIGGGGPVVYDCMDRWSDFPDALADENYRRVIVDAEQRLLERADLVFCSAAGLFESKSKTAKGEVMLLRNGADVAHFLPGNRVAPQDIASLPRPILGYIGAMADWVDFELLRSVAVARPEWSLVFIGPLFDGKSSGDADSLRLIASLPNVHLLGSRPYDELPPYLEAFDVAVIPFKLNGLTEDTDPIKVYEYLAAGVPVVSTPLREVQRLPEVRLASGPEEFVRECEAALSERSDADLVARRTEVARCNSWETRAEAAWQSIVGIADSSC